MEIEIVQNRLFLNLREHKVSSLSGDACQFSDISPSVFTVYEAMMDTKRSASRKAVVGRLRAHLRRGSSDVVGHTGQSMASGNPDVESMDAFEVLYLLCKSEGLTVAGDPKRAFAHFNSSAGILHVYTRSDDAVDVSKSVTTTMLAALECAQKEGASFTASGEDVVCTLKGVTARGYTYGEAAIRALAKQQLASEHKP